MVFSIVASSSDDIRIPHTSCTARVSMVITSKKKQDNETKLFFNMTIKKYTLINGRLNPEEICFKRSQIINPNMAPDGSSDMVLDDIRLTNTFSLKVG